MKSKKVLIGSLSTMALVATPIAAVVSCDNNKATTDADKKVAPKATITKANAKGFLVWLDDHDKFYVSEELAKKPGELKIVLKGDVAAYTWDKPITLKGAVIKVHQGELSTVLGRKSGILKVTQADEGDFVIKPALWPEGSGYIVSKDTTSRALIDRLLATQGTNDNILGIKLPIEKTTTNISKVTAAGIKEINDFLKPLDWVVKMITSTKTPAVPAKALDASSVGIVHGWINNAKTETNILFTLNFYLDGSGNPIDTSTVKNAKGADAAAKLAAQKTAAKALITTATQKKAVPAVMSFHVSWDSTPAEDRAKYQKDVDKIAALFTQKTSPGIPVVAVKAKAKLPHATIAAINTFVGAGFITTPAILDPLKMVDVTFEMEVTHASTATTNGEAVLTIIKGKADRQVTKTVTFVITHP